MRTVPPNHSEANARASSTYALNNQPALTPFLKMPPMPPRGVYWFQFYSSRSYYNLPAVTLLTLDIQLQSKMNKYSWTRLF